MVVLQRSGAIGRMDDIATAMFLKTPYLPGEDPHLQRVQTFAQRSLPLGIVAHGLAALFLALLGLFVGAAINIFSVVFYLVLLALVRRGRIHLTLYLAIVELLVFSVLSTYLVGWASGYYLWVMFLPLLVFSGYRWRLWVQVSAVLLGLAAIALMVTAVLPHPPFYTVSAGATTAIFAFNGVVLFFSYLGYSRVLSATTEHAERDLFRANRSNRNLLLNILPESIADRLNDSRATIADAIPESTVLFLDLAGFTSRAATMSAEQVVSLLNGIFYRFDEVVEELGMEKIKTIGDGYMAAAGVPHPTPDHAITAVACAVRMLQCLAAYNREHRSTVRARIGIHSGRVVAGVIGKHKFTYDLWGDTVNTAARMESHGIVGKIQISEPTYQLVRHACRAQYRGSIQVKGKGRMNTYLVAGIRAGWLQST